MVVSARLKQGSSILPLNISLEDRLRSTEHAGDALLFYNMNTDGKQDAFSLHTGESSCSKNCATKQHSLAKEMKPPKCQSNSAFI